MTLAACAQPHISEDWQDEDISLYLDRCQIDTPSDLVALTWREVHARRDHVAKVVDFGAGDGRFAVAGVFDEYVGYEIDARRSAGRTLPTGATIEHRCAFSPRVEDAALCIGNPPFVRNQDLPAGWREKVARQLEERSGVRLSGLANAWQYFFLLSLVSAAEDGLCAIVIPYEWVSRPSAAAIRSYIRAAGWDVDVYRVADATFGGVLTTSSVTIVDKRGRSGRWRYFKASDGGGFSELASESGSTLGHLPYVSRRDAATGPRAARGLSPGSQNVFTFTEAERARHGLLTSVDVVRCVTSLRPMARDASDLDEAAFNGLYRNGGQRCWLLNITEGEPSERVRRYLDSIDEWAYATATCRERPVWWKFKMPETPNLLVATSFKGERPKLLRNSVAAKAVGGVAGIHDIDEASAARFVAAMTRSDLADRIVAHAKGLRKIEINQLNSLLAEVT